MAKNGRHTFENLVHSHEPATLRLISVGVFQILQNREASIFWLFRVATRIAPLLFLFSVPWGRGCGNPR